MVGVGRDGGEGVVQRVKGAEVIRGNAATRRNLKIAVGAEEPNQEGGAPEGKKKRKGLPK